MRHRDMVPAKQGIAEYSKKAPLILPPQVF